MFIRENIFYLKIYGTGNENDGSLSKWDPFEDFLQNPKETQLVLGGHTLFGNFITLNTKSSFWLPLPKHI